MKVLLCEKPSVARGFADGLEKLTKKRSSRKDGYIEVGEYLVTWAFGHLLQLEPSLEEGGSFNDFPKFPKNWDYKPSKDSAKQLKIVSSVLKRASEIIIATDPGREGELIARLIIYHVYPDRPKMPMYRVWTSDTLTDAVVAREMMALKPAADYDTLYDEAIARQHADWLVGINMTRAVMNLISQRSRWSVGRVQTPTLAVLVSREEEIQNFKPEPFSTINGIFENGSSKYTGAFETGRDGNGNVKKISEADAKAVVAEARRLGVGEIVEVGSHTKNEKPPLLHTITTAQIQANESYGFSGDKTAKILQALYEKHKCLSYPRTESKYLSTGNADLVKDVLKALKRSDLLPKVDIKNKNIFNDAKLTDHHALIPTAPARNLSADEQKVYDIVHNTFLAAFYPDAVSEVFRIKTKVGNYMFSTNGTQDKIKGWKELLKPNAADRDFSFALAKGTQVNVKDLTLQNKMTTPPGRYTEAKLLKVMENAHLLLPESEREKRKVMKNKEISGLGTGATRSGIIQNLRNKEFFTSKGKSLVPTDKAMKLIIAIRQATTLTDPMLTADWETELERIRSSATTYDIFIGSVENFVSGEIESLREAKSLQQLTFDDGFKGVACPACDKETLDVFPAGAVCKSCEASFWKKFASKKITDVQFKKLLKKQSVYIKGFKSKKGTKYDAWLIVKDGRFQLDFSAPPKAAATKKAGGLKKPAGGAKPLTKGKGLVKPAPKKNTMVNKLKTLKKPS